MSKGIHLETEHGFTTKSTTASSLTLGTQQSYNFGNVFRIYGAAVNAINVGENGAINPTLDWGINAFTTSYTFKEDCTRAILNSYHLQTLRAQQQNYEVNQTRINATLSALHTESQRIAYADGAIDFATLKTIQASITQNQTELDTLLAQTKIEQANTVAKLSKAALDQASTRVVSGDVEVNGNKLVLMG
ncbi:hypothetical protein M9194_13765 [Vibrio sp. S4M6]|uniref:hypothetical protein n=1 Tax=Vibrio sinus TaxID=2946865 RepID=UPI00202A2707|nr:hypothetical protein [Vibrio sinus]MCL9782497.1 hypothetical protein [Vibrio sinus]